MYRSKDINFMNELKKKVNETTYYAESNNFQTSWEHLRRYIVIDDLNMFLRVKYGENSLPYIPEYVYNNHFVDVDYMFVTASENQAEIDILNSIVKKAGITSYYRTSYLKHSNLIYYKEHQDLSSVLKNEIQVIKPKFVIFFGLPIAAWSLGLETRHKAVLKGDIQMIATSSILDLLSNKNNSNQKLAIKHLIWSDIHSDRPF